MNEFLTWLLGAVQSVDPVLRTLLAGLAMACETSVLLGLIVPGDTVVIIAGTAVKSVPEALVLMLAVLAGSLAGETLGFWLGHWLGPKLRHSKLGARIGEGHWERADLYLRRRGGVAIFISRFLPVLHSLVPLTVGMSSHYSYRRFLAWTIPACTVWTVAYVSVSAAAAGAYRQLASRLHYAGYVFIAAIVVFLLVVFLIRKALAAREARHMRRDAAEETVPDADGMRD